MFGRKGVREEPFAAGRGGVPPRGERVRLDVLKCESIVSRLHRVAHRQWADHQIKIVEYVVD